MMFSFNFFLYVGKHWITNKKGHDKLRGSLGGKCRNFILEFLMALFFAAFEQGAPGQTYIDKMGTNYLKIM